MNSRISRQHLLLTCDGSTPASALLQRLSRVGALVSAVVFLSACDQLGVDTPAKVAERKLSEAKAVGGACRHAMRAIEDCYSLNPKADKSAVFLGWREMDEYMRENKLDGVVPTVPRVAQSSAKPSKPSPDEEDAEADSAESPE